MRRLWVSLLLTGCSAAPVGPTAGAALVVDRWHAPTAVSVAPYTRVESQTPPAASRQPAGTGAAPRGTGGSAREAPGAPPPAPLAGRVLDQAGAPIAGAVVWLASGESAPTDAEGRFLLGTVPPGSPLGVSKPGYALSVVYGLSGEATLHLRRIDGRSGEFEQGRYAVTGRAALPEGGLGGGVAYYVDTLASSANPVPLGPDGSFSIDVSTLVPGRPRAVVLVLATDAAGRQLVGLTPAFTPGEATLPVLPMHLADRSHAFDVDRPPPGLDLVESRLEIQQEGGPTLVLEGARGLTGAFYAPAPDALPGLMRLVIEARSADGLQTSELAQAAAEGPLVGGFLAPPAVTRLGQSVSWQPVAEATGYRVETRHHEALGPLWEAWCPAPATLALPAEAWPEAGRGVLRVEAVDAPDLAARHVAGLRALRIAPWRDRPAYRVASRTLSVD